MNAKQNDITATLLPAYLDGSLELNRRQQVEKRLATDPELREAFEILQKQEKALFNLGAMLRESAPSVDLHDTVMDNVQRSEADMVALEHALSDLGSDLHAVSPPLDIVESVMQAVAKQEHASDTLETELVETGEELRVLAPRVDVVEEVMDEVTSGHLDAIADFEAIKRAKAARRRQSVPSWSFVAAAAACVLAVAGFVAMQMAKPPALQEKIFTQNITSETTASPNQQNAQTGEKPVRKHEGESMQFDPVSTDERISLLSATIRPASPQKPEKKVQPQRNDLRMAVNVDAIIAARRDALAGKTEALARLARWGALDPDEIRLFIAEGLLSPKALAGLSRFLPKAEARALLREALAQEPEDAMLHFALARNLMNDPEQYDAARQELERFRELTPDNSLSYYMDAQILLAQGDYAGALQSIEYAASFQSGSAYALENAQYHSNALHTAGLPDDVAQMLAAFNAGSDEYGFLTQLGTDLLGYGAYYESVGDYEAALAIYKGVNQMGLQITQGADFSNEMLAGLDTQQASIEAIDALATLMDIPGGAYTVEIAYTVFMQGMDFFLEYTNVFENIIGDAEATNILRSVDQIMQTGDINYLNKN